jgi:DNA-binding response OmpR family regulator
MDYDGRMQPPSILIVEDDRSLAGLIADYLVEHGFRVLVESRGDRAASRILDERPSLVVLDIMLPGEDGLSVCRKVRNHYPGPILMLTARGNEPDEVIGLDIGADDYLTKPVRPRVLLARLRALLRRPFASAEEGGPPGRSLARLDIGDLSIDPTIREAKVRGALLPLTSGEFDLLWLLVSHAGETLSRKAMHRSLRGAEYDDFDRSIDLRVSRLRQKISDATSGQEAIKTVRGVGYLYVKR